MGGLEGGGGVEAGWRVEMGRVEMGGLEGGGGVGAGWRGCCSMLVDGQAYGAPF